MGPRDIVAVILAASVLFYVLGATVLREWLVGHDAPPPEYMVEGLPGIVNVLIGALSGYIIGLRQGGGN